MIVDTMTSRILYTISGNFPDIILSNIFQVKQKVWNGEIFQTKLLTLRKNLWKTIALSGLLVGSLDIIAALVNFYTRTGKDPVIVLKYIASAVFGSSAFSAGYKMAVFGLVFHFVVAFAWTIFFFLVYPKLKLLSWNRIVTGIIYGIFIWLIMNLIVVPITKASTGVFDLRQAIVAVLILIGAIGLPLSFIAHWFYKSRTG